MRFTLPFLIGLAVFALTTLGANLTSFNPHDDLLFDFGLAADSLAYRLENGFGVPADPALVIGAVLLALPAVFAFHLCRLLFGGSVVALRAEGRTDARTVRSGDAFEDLMRRTSSGTGTVDVDGNTHAQPKFAGAARHDSDGDERDDDGTVRQRGLGLGSWIQRRQDKRAAARVHATADTQQSSGSPASKDARDAQSPIGGQSAGERPSGEEGQRSAAGSIPIDEIDEADLEALTRPDLAGQDRELNPQARQKPFLERKPDLSALKSGLSKMKARRKGE